MPSTPPASFAELCRRYDISRKSGYTWLDRYARLGPESLADRSHRPDACPHATAPAVIREILQLRKSWRWGARKLHELLLDAHPGEAVPAIPTIHRILVRHGRVRRRRRSHETCAVRSSMVATRSRERARTSIRSRRSRIHISQRFSRRPRRSLATVPTWRPRRS
jgi:hypothetical protein